MEVVNTYKYLGIYFSTKLSVSYACQDLVARAKRAIICILKTMYRFEKSSAPLFLKLFDCQVQPILQYGAEIWAFVGHDVIEKAHLFALKRFLGVDRRTPNDFVYGEFGRYPLFVNSYVRCLKYWLKLISMDNARLPCKAYKMLYQLDQNGKKNWVTYIRECLCHYGFRYVWDNQGVGDVNTFVRCFRERIVDCRWQDWHNHINNSDRYSFYCQFKSNNFIEPYMNLSINRYVVKALVYFRLGISSIIVHSQRYKENVSNNVSCRLCGIGTENEIHIVLCCSELQNIRNELIPAKFYRHPSLFRLNMLLANQNEKILGNLALYLYKCFKLLEHASS